jgi:cytochrome d ubiquinol oxidase subunit I
MAVDQDYLLEARQMQTLSFVVHIPLVCFAIAFPAIVLFGFLAVVPQEVAP